MYVKPGVYIYQNYERRNIVLPERPEFAAAIAGVCYPIVEGSRAYVGTIDFSSNIPPHVTFMYPKLDELFDNVISSSVRVYLVPAAGTQNVRIESFTRDYLRKFGIKRDFEGPIADVTEAVRNYMWTDDEGNDRVGIESYSVTIPTTFNLNEVVTYNGFKFDTDGKPAYPACNVYIEYRAYRSPESVSITEEFTKAGETTFELQHFPIQPGSVTVILSQNESDTDVTESCTINHEGGIVTYPAGIPSGGKLKVTYKVVNPIYKSKTLIRSVDDIEANFGAPHVYNPVALGAYLAFINAGHPVYAIAVPATITGTTEVDTNALENAIVEFGADEIYTIAVMDSVKRIVGTVESFINAYADPTKSSLKIAMLGFDGFDDASSGFAAHDPEQAKKDLMAFAYNLNNMRIRILLNPMIDIDLFGITMPVPGYYYGAIYGGQVTRIMRDFPAQPLTNTKAPVAGVRYTVFKTSFFSEDDLNELAETGYWILTEEPDGVYVRHQLTTAETDYATREDSIVRAVDAFTMTLRKVLKALIGNNTLTKNFINDTLIPIVSEHVKNAVRNGWAGERTALTNVMLEAPDTVTISIDYDPPFPANVIKLVISI